jgi:hypothetical protein
VDLRSRLLKRLKKYEFTVLYFTNMPMSECLSGVLHMHDNAQATIYDIDEVECAITDNQQSGEDA